jgi:hydroxymethylpyrimidine pyrophosphatase-like HAD family hydrolase
MRYRALATDYDGTIAHDGAVDAATIAALGRLRAAGVRLILITGRELPDLRAIMPRLDLFALVVAENGGLLHDPATGEETALAGPPPAGFVARLRQAGVAPLSVGRVIVGTETVHEATVRAAIGAHPALAVILNKGSLMVLPRGIDKASGLAAALDRLGVPPGECVGVGDAENDLAFLELCGLPVAVANALDTVKRRVAVVTAGARGAGVAELAGRLLAGEATPATD